MPRLRCSKAHEITVFRFRDLRCGYRTGIERLRIEPQIIARVLNKASSIEGEYDPLDYMTEK